MKRNGCFYYTDLERLSKWQEKVSIRISKPQLSRISTVVNPYLSYRHACNPVLFPGQHHPKDSDGIANIVRHREDEDSEHRDHNEDDSFYCHRRTPLSEQGLPYSTASRLTPTH